MKVFTALFFLFILTNSVLADDVVKDFTFVTLDGKTLDFSSLKSTPLVINIGAHW
jgi:hypothetical protein